MTVEQSESGLAQPRAIVLRQARAWVKAIRVHQWSKNVLVFAPLFLAHAILDPWPLRQSLLAFACFCLAASALYLVNDVVDAPRDRTHPHKKSRPFASGLLDPAAGLAAACALFATALAAAWLIQPMLAGVLAIYGAVTLSYCLYFRRTLMLDVLALTAGYILRILAGNAATGIEVSAWLLAFALFFFISLTLIKRYCELDQAEPDQPAMGRGYRRSDLELVSQLGVGSALAAVVVLALYVDSAGAGGLYRHPMVLWLICPIMFYIVARLWFLARRREIEGDPVMFLMQDWRTYLMAGVILATIWLAA
jgi:4-hydroxybenzoate polyprenyltransferase